MDHQVIADLRQAAQEAALVGHLSGVYLWEYVEGEPLTIKDPHLLSGLLAQSDDLVSRILQGAKVWQVMRWDGSNLCRVALAVNEGGGRWAIHCCAAVGCLVGKKVEVDDVAFQAFLESVDVLDLIGRGRVTENVE